MTVVVDTGALISLLITKQLDLIEDLLGDYYISKAVWNELTNYSNPIIDQVDILKIKDKVKSIQSNNYLRINMDLGESESVILYNELNANYLLIDDKKARLIAESLNVNCIGTLGLLLKAKQTGRVNDLRTIFIEFILAERFYSKKLLNNLLIKLGEVPIK